MTEEIWKDITSYEGLYKVSNLGKISECCRGTRSHTGGYIWKYKNND